MIKQPIRVVFFDLGNTLLYDKEPWKELYKRADQALWESLHGLGLKSSPAELYGRQESIFQYYYKLRENDLEEPGIGSVLEELLNQKKIQIPEEDLKAALRAMYKITQANWYLEDDAIPTLQTLKQRGYGLGIISNGADDENTQTLIDQVHIRPYFEYILSSAAFGLRKPHPGIFRAALDHFHVPPEQTVMIGDTYDADIVGAQGVGMNSIWITRRVRETATRIEAPPDAIVSTLSEIPALLST